MTPGYRPNPRFQGEVDARTDAYTTLTREEIDRDCTGTLAKLMRRYFDDHAREAKAHLEANGSYSPSGIHMQLESDAYDYALGYLQHAMKMFAIKTVLIEHGYPTWYLDGLVGEAGQRLEHYADEAAVRAAVLDAEETPDEAE